MAEVDIKYRGNSIATMNASGTKTLGTQNKYCDSDIVVEYTQPAQAVIESNKNATPSETAQEITPSSGYDAMAKVTVGAVSSSYVGTAIPRKASANLSASGATVTAPAGYYENNATKSVGSGSATTPATTITANPTISVSSGGLITASVSVFQSVTPTISAGYVSSGTAGTVTVTGNKTSQLTAQAAQTIHPSASDQSIASGKFLTGAQTIKAVTTTNLTAANIKSGVVVEVGDSTDSDCVTSVTGTYSGGSSWTLLGSTTLTVNTTSTTAGSAGTIDCGTSAATKAKLIYVRVRDKAGPRAGYFYGSDAFFANYYVANDPHTGAILTGAARIGQMYTSSSQWASGGSSYGVYGYSISPAGVVTIRRKYSSSYGTINGKFLCEVYALDYPDGKSPFDTGEIT